MSCTLGLVYFGIFCNVYEYLRILTGTSYTRLHCVVVVVCLRNYFPSYFVHRENVLNIKEILSWRISELYTIMVYRKAIILETYGNCLFEWFIKCLDEKVSIGKFDDLLRTI